MLEKNYQYFDLYKSLKSGGILLEIPSSCFDDTLERVTLTLPKSVITGIDAVSPNRAQSLHNWLKNLLTEIISKSSCCGSATVIFFV
ncbi:hypothetical protein [Acinetobacter baumannii]|uniref:hypothetical protein n=1 Tax=Acinetobacter baumannii TaxID=470 RepID=UPI001D18E11C|nr:hypothetical protein [Acinetobacter baumannii]